VLIRDDNPSWKYRIEGAVMSRKTSWFRMALLLGAFWPLNSFAQEVGGKVEITQVDVSRFPEVTVFFKVTGPAGNEIRDLRPQNLELIEEGKPVQILQLLGMGSFQVTTVLLVDCSGSMNDVVSQDFIRTGQTIIVDGQKREVVEPAAGKKLLTKLDAAKDACMAFLSYRHSTDDIALICFDTRVTVSCALGTPANSVRQAVQNLHAQGGTAWRDAVFKALALLESRQGRRNIVLLTDGQDNSSSQDISTVIAQARRLQIPIYAIALGDAEQVDDREMRVLADETGGSYLLMPRAEHLARLYEDMGKSVHQEFGVTYRSNRPTPDGTRRVVQLTVRIREAVITGGTEYLERHLLNIESHLGVFFFWLILLSLCYAGPYLRDARREHAFRRACREAFLEELPQSKVSAAAVPTVDLAIQVHPKALLRDVVARIVSVRIDTSLRIPQHGVLLYQPLYLIVLLDLSASMEGERLGAARAAIRSLLAGMADSDSFCLVGFSDDASTVVPPIRVGAGRDEVAARLNDLRMGARTVLGPALVSVKSVLPPVSPAKRHKTCAVIVSDGKIEDRARALDEALWLRERISLYALGIGADYDHEFLAQVCGGKERVDHLDTPQDAAAAFQRLVTLYGHAVTANTRFRFQLPPSVKLQRVTAQRHVQELPVDDQVVVVGDLPATGALSYLAEFQVTPAECGTSLLAECSVLFDLPGYGHSGCETQERIFISVTDDRSRANVPNPEVLRIARIIQASKMVDKAEEHLQGGEVRAATQKLKQVSQRFMELGEHDKAQAVNRLRNCIEADSANTDLAIKRVRGTTKRLTE
jgi:Mg-chelatase subunit ChlD